MIVASFSGGRTSAYMCKMLIDKYPRDQLAFVFINTGAEDFETLEFVNNCDIFFGLDLVWLEAVVHHDDRKGTTHKIVDFFTADREGEAFREVCKKYGIPNKSYPHCNRELKLRPIDSWQRENHPSAPRAIGIRVDEIDRMSAHADRDNVIYPLVSARIAKSDVMGFWSRTPFDLEVPEHRGNCVTCWKKSDRKLKTLALESPESFDLFKSIERDFSKSGAPKNSGIFFRGHRTCEDIIASSSDDFKIFRDPFFKNASEISNGCDEQCDLFTDE